jgi:hypothetical protein
MAGMPKVLVLVPEILEERILAFLKHRLEDTGECALTLDDYRPLLDPECPESEAETKIHGIDIDLFDCGVAANELSESASVFVDMLKHPQCRAPARMLMSLYGYLVGNAEQDRSGSYPLAVGFDTRTPRFASFNQYDFLAGLPKAIGAGIPTYLGMLDHDDPAVRGWAAAVLSCHLPDDEDVGEQLLAHAVKETDPGVAASLVLATSLQFRYHGVKAAEFRKRLGRCLTDSRLPVAAAATIALLHQAPATAGGTSQNLRCLFEEKNPVPRKDLQCFTLDDRDLRLAAAQAIPAGCAHDEEWLDTVLGLLDCTLEVGRDALANRMVATGAALALEFRPNGELTERQRKLAEALLAHPKCWTSKLDDCTGGKNALRRRLGAEAVDGKSAGSNFLLVRELRGMVAGTDVITHCACRAAADLSESALMELLEEYFIPQDAAASPHRIGLANHCPWTYLDGSKEADRRFVRFIQLGTELMVEKGNAIVPLVEKQFLIPVPSRDFWRFHMTFCALLALARLGATGIAVPDGFDAMWNWVARIDDLAPDIRTLLQKLPMAERVRLLHRAHGGESEVLYFDCIDPGEIKGFIERNCLVDDVHFPQLLAKLAEENQHAERDAILLALAKIQDENATLYGPEGARRRAKVATFDLSDGTTASVRLVPRIRAG